MQESREERVHEELEDLLQEVEDFRQEKEQVRAIVGKIGGVPSKTTKMLNITFFSLLTIVLIVALLPGSERLHWAMIDIAIFAVSLKLIYLIHKQSQVNHLQTWILSSLEWRINEILKQLRKMEKGGKPQKNPESTGSD